MEQPSLARDPAARYQRVASAIAALIGAVTLVAELWAGRPLDAPTWRGVALSVGLIAFGLAGVLGWRGRVASTLAFVGFACALAVLGLFFVR